MVKSMEITKSSIRERLIIDSEVWMHHPDDHDFQPRASIEGRILSVSYTHLTLPTIRSV